MKKLVLLGLLLAALSLIAGCMGPMMHENHDDYPNDPDGSHMSDHHH